MNQLHEPKKSSLPDWSRPRITMALWEAGWTLRQLSRHHGYKSSTTLARALERSWPKGERLIAAAIGVKPELIWPSRYQFNTSADSNAPKRRFFGRKVAA